MKKLFQQSWSDIFLNIFPFLIVFTASLYRPRDADLGWILKYGEYFVKQGRLLYENTFSTMMPDYRWVNHSWASDIISYITFSNFGFFGYSILGALVLTLTFYFFSKAFNLSVWEKGLILPFLVFLENTVNSSSFRPQLLSFLFLGILFYILRLYGEGSKNKLFWLILLFLIWANIHGLYILGLALFALWFLGKSLEEVLIEKSLRKELLYSLKLPGIVFILTILATLINPFGTGVYTESFRHFFNPWQKYIIEWQPISNVQLVFWKHIILGAVITMGVLGLFFDNKLKKSLAEALVFSPLYLLAFFMRRYAWSAYYLSIPFIRPVVNIFKPKNRNAEKSLLISILLIIFAVTIVVKSPFRQYVDMSWKTFCELRRCSEKSVEYLIENGLSKKKLFTLYDWGGWLIWNYPEIKPTIDGRMHLWRDENGYSAFAEYYPLEQNWSGYEIDDTEYNVVFISTRKSIYKKMLQLVDNGKWKLRYRDDDAAIFERI